MESSLRPTGKLQGVGNEVSSPPPSQTAVFRHRDLFLPPARDRENPGRPGCVASESLEWRQGCFHTCPGCFGASDPIRSVPDTSVVPG